MNSQAERTGEAGENPALSRNCKLVSQWMFSRTTFPAGIKLTSQVASRSGVSGHFRGEEAEQQMMIHQVLPFLVSLNIIHNTMEEGGQYQSSTLK